MANTIQQAPSRRRIPRHLITAAGLTMGGALLIAGEAGCADAGLPDSVDSVRGFLRNGIDELLGLPPANAGAWEGGPTDSADDTQLNNVLADEDDRRPDEATPFNVPTNGPPSPLYGAASFSQQMFRFEEFGLETLEIVDPPVPTSAGQASDNPSADRRRTAPDFASPNDNNGNRRGNGGGNGNGNGNGNGSNGNLTIPALALPVPADAQNSPDGPALDIFLGKRLLPMPTRQANEQFDNPWRPLIEASIGRVLDTPPIEGRPPGEDWAHQRWDEFSPEVYFQSAQAGARANGGVRDRLQSHHYAMGEFAPQGLYHNTTGTPGFRRSTDGIAVRFHPDMPIQDANAVWTFDGTLPPKLLRARYGEPILFRHHNALPVDVTANRGFGIHTITTHEHNGHHPAESDGFANAFFFPGQFYDYHWPMVLAGHDTINADAQDPRAGRPDGHGGIENIPGDWRETMSTHWFHDHMLDFTAQNVYKGNAAMSNYYSSVDRGNEAIDDGVNLRLPSGTALDWGNRDYDVNLLIADKAWDDEGQLWFNPFNLNGFIGDQILTNWQYHPYFDVRARRYRFRILNGSVSRYFKIALVDEAGNPVPFYMVANDGNIMEHSVYFADGTLPTQGIAERYDIVVDFSGFAPGDRLYFVNLLSHKDGQVTDQAIPLVDVINGTYSPIAVDTNGDGTADEWQGGDPAVGKFLEFRVAAYSGTDQSMDPSSYVEGGNTMIPLRRPSETEIAAARHRNFEFEKNPTDEAPWVIETDGGKGVGMDPRRVSAAPQLACDPSAGPCTEGSGTLEIWRLVNGGNWSHPVHIHFEEGIILSRGNQPPPPHERWARKDLYRIGPQPDSGAVVEIALRFREFAGTFMEHCHNTQHEDHAMLLRWDIEHPGQTLIMPTPMPTWDGVEYADTVALPTFRTGDGTGYGPPLEPMVVWADGAEVDNVDLTSVGGLADWTTGVIEPEGDDERGTITIPLQVGTNDDNGVLTPVYFFISEVSDEDLAAQFGVGHMGALEATPPPASAVGQADYTNGAWTFYGNLPNPIPTVGDGSPAQDPANTYTPVRQATVDGKTAYFNIAFVSWGPNSWERLRVDTHCTFPDNPANTNCRYQGKDLGTDTAGQIVALDLGANPSVTFKLHKAWFSQEYLPYYTITDAWPCGPANGMGVICVPKHADLELAARPLIQFLPQTAFANRLPPNDGTGFPPTVVAHNIDGGGPLGGQPGVPSYFMPGPDYSPLWHIGFTRWNEAHPDMVQVTSYEELLALRDQGRVSIFEFPPSPPRIAGTGLPPEGDYDTESLSPAHVVNCPVPATLDVALLRASR